MSFNKTHKALTTLTCETKEIVLKNGCLNKAHTLYTPTNKEDLVQRPPFLQVHSKVFPLQSAHFNVEDKCVFPLQSTYVNVEEGFHRFDWSSESGALQMFGFFPRE